MTKKMIAVASAAIIAVVFYTQFSLFVIQPIGAIPEGKTLLMLRMNKTEFIDSADALCARQMNGVNLICRGVAMSTVVTKELFWHDCPIVSSYTVFLQVVGSIRDNGNIIPGNSDWSHSCHDRSI